MNNANIIIFCEDDKTITLRYPSYCSGNTEV